ncbi:MAG: zinc-ribbon domain-containing protein [Candidatus Lokiarchaeota archaeon]|nr:zinc-ribbon domain-containing protein [Candidatus Lokiarchaeota archaeon]
MQQQPTDTKTLFTKKLSNSIALLVLVIMLAIISGIMPVFLGISPAVFMISLIVNLTSPITIAVCLVIFSGIGKAKGLENRTMSFVFGLLTLGLSIGMVVDRALKIAPNISSLTTEISLIQSNPAVYIPILILRIGFFAILGIVIALAIVSIVNSVAIIKENLPSGSSHAARPAASSTISTTTIASTPPASANVKAQFCSSCGAALETGALFCNKCGAKV